jgi:NHS family xanthosine MFS transporter
LAGFLETETNPKMLEFIKTKGLISADGVLSKEIFMKDWHTIWLAFALRFDHRHRFCYFV